MDVLRISYCYALALGNEEITDGDIVSALLQTDASVRISVEQGLSEEDVRRNLKACTEGLIKRVGNKKKNADSYELSDKNVINSLGATLYYIVTETIKLREDEEQSSEKSEKHERFSAADLARGLANKKRTEEIGTFLNLLATYIDEQLEAGDSQMYSNFKSLIEDILGLSDEESTPNTGVGMDSELKDTIASLIYDYTTVIPEESFCYGRDKLINRINEVLSCVDNRAVLVVGDSGVGKTTLIDAYVNMVQSGKLETAYEKTLFTGIHFDEYIKLANTPNLVTYLKAVISTLVECGSFLVIDNVDDFIYDRTFMILIRHAIDVGCSLIMTITPEAFNQLFARDTKLLRRMEVINLDEMSVEDSIRIYEMQLSSVENNLDMEPIVSRELLELAAGLSDRYIKEGKMPDKLGKVVYRAITKVLFKGKQLVDESDVLETVSEISSVDINKLGKNEANELLKLEDTLGKRIIGQERAIEVISNSVRRGKAGISLAEKPISSMLFTGPTGVGKTELCKTLVDVLGYSKEQFIRLDMSEYKEEYTVSKLIGSAPGYVGYEQGGQLTEKVRKNPYSVVLFDEIEKANESVYDLLLQILDAGRLTDSKGNTVDFSNCIIVMTSNAGYGVEQLEKNPLGFGTVNKSSEERTEEIVKQALEKTFKPEFLNRIDQIVKFNRLSKEDCSKIAVLELKRLADTLKTQGYKVEFDSSVASEVNDRGYSEKYGARNIKRQVQSLVADQLAREILGGTLTKENNFTVTYENNELHFENRK